MMHTANFHKAHVLLRWLKSQYAVTSENEHDNIAAAAMAAHLNVKDQTIDRIMWQLTDLGYPRTEEPIP